MREVPGLIALGSKWKDRGLVLLFFPCNQFCNEEPGTAADIKAFYVDKHKLPASSLMERIDVNGSKTHAVYRFLKGRAKDIDWNFTKFVVGRNGQVLGRYGQEVKPPFFDRQLPAWLGAGK